MIDMVTRDAFRFRTVTLSMYIPVNKQLYLRLSIRPCPLFLTFTLVLSCPFPFLSLS